MSPAELDRALLIILRTRGHSRTAEQVVAAFSRTGEHALCWLLLGGLGAVLARDPGRRRAWRRGVGVVIGSYVLNQAIKFTVRRRRPELDGLAPLTETVSSLSLPSAHATTSFAAARAYAELASPALLYGAATAFAFSRPYLGVHYPSDVVVGAALGTAFAKLAAS